jgi:hypothetical protein
MSTIDRGDVVMVVKWPHPHVAAQCRPGTVSIVRAVQERTTCPTCGHVWHEPSALLEFGGAIPASWLRKLGETVAGESRDQPTDSRERASFKRSASGLVGSER